MNYLHCPNCGAPLSNDILIDDYIAIWCEYCGDRLFFLRSSGEIVSDTEIRAHTRAWIETGPIVTLKLKPLMWKGKE